MLICLGTTHTHFKQCPTATEEHVEASRGANMPGGPYQTPFSWATDSSQLGHRPRPLELRVQKY